MLSTSIDVDVERQFFLSETFISRDDTDHHDALQVLKQIRTKNLHNVIVGLLNVNSIASKFDAIKCFIPGNIDVMIFCETKLDDSYPTGQFLMDGFKKPFRLDRNAHGGGLLIYIRTDIACTLKRDYKLSGDIEGMFVELNFRKSKWLLF